jgi:hypothetical protein
MAVTRRLVAQDDNDENQWLKVDHSSRYIVNDMDDWQFIFGPDSVLSNSNQIVKIGAKFNDDTFSNIQITSYLYDQKNASIANAASCSIKVYKVTTPDWTEQLVTTLATSTLPNTYFYANPTITSLGIDFQGGDTILIESTIVRLGVIYRDRIYFNHIGIYDNVTRLRRDVEFLEVTKKDL